MLFNRGRFNRNKFNVGVPHGLSSTDTLLLKITESSASPEVSLTGTDTLLLKFTESGASPSVSLTGTDTLLLKFYEGANSPADTNISASDTLLMTLGESASAPSAALTSADALLLKFGTETGLSPAVALSATETLLLKFGTETGLLTAALSSTDTLLLDPDLESVIFQALISASDTLLIDPDYDSVVLVGNELGACEATIRGIHGRIKITYSSPSLDEGITLTATDTAYGADVYDTADNILGTDYPIFSLQENDLSGDYHPAPASVGWWSATLSDASGDFSPAMVLTATFDEARPVYDLQVYGDDELDNYPVNFVIKLYDVSDTLLHTETVTGNTLWNWTTSLSSTIDDVTKIELSITKISQASRSAIVTEFITAYSETYEDDEILYFSVLEERDYSGGTLPIGNVSANEIVVRLKNTDDHFSVDNTSSPVYDLMKKNRRIEAWIGVEVPYGSSISWSPLGVFWSQDWSTPQDEVYAEVVGLDRLESLRNTEFYSEQVYEDNTLTQLATLVLTDAGLAAADYSIHTDLDSITVPYSYFGRTTHRDALVEIAEAAMGTVFTDRDGKVVITPYANETLPSYTLSSGRYFTKDQPLAFSEMINYVEVIASPRSPGTQEVIYSDTEELAVPGKVDGVNGEAERWCIYNTSDPCIDVQTATANATGGTITLKSQVDYTWASLLTYQNSNAEAGIVEDIEIQGKILGTTGEKVAIAQDTTSIRQNGKQALTSPVENAFIQTMSRAQTIADALLAAYKDPRRDVVVQARGYTASRLGERMSVQSLDGEQTADYTITRQQVEYDGGLKVEMTGQKIAS